MCQHSLTASVSDWHRWETNKCHFRCNSYLSKKKYCSELFVSTFSWHVLRINIFLWPWRRRNAWWRLQLACNLVSYYICNKMSPCIEMRWQTSSFAMHNRDDHIWSRARLGICSNGIGRNTGRCLKEVKCTCRNVVYEFLKRNNWEKLSSCKSIFRGGANFDIQITIQQF